MSNLKLIYSVCVLGAFFTIQGESQERVRMVSGATGAQARVGWPLHQGGIQNIPGHDGGGIKPYPGQDGAGTKPIPLVGSSYTGTEGNTLYRLPNGVAVTMPASNALGYHNMDNGRSFYTDPTNTAVGYRAPGSDTVNYVQNLNGTVSALSYNWGDQTGSSFAPPTGNMGPNGNTLYRLPNGAVVTGTGGNALARTPNGVAVALPAASAFGYHNTDTGRSFYTDPTNTAVGYRAPGSTTVRYVQNLDGTVSAQTYNWANSPYAPTGTIGGNPIVWGPGYGVAPTGIPGGDESSYTPQGYAVEGGPGSEPTWPYFQSAPTGNRESASAGSGYSQAGTSGDFWIR